MAQAHIPRVREWLTSLGILSAVSMSKREAEMKLAAFVPLLARDFPDAAFTQDSLSHVARRCPYFPTYHEICEHLGSWWRDRRPMPIALPPPPPTPPRPPPTPEEREYIGARVAEVVASLRNADSEPRPGPTARYLSPGVLDAINPLPNGMSRVTGRRSTPPPTAPTPGGEGAYTGWERDDVH
jgi:hypothetical protein